jgi:xylose isomerase
MNRLSIITAFLGSVKNRFMSYQDDRSLAEKFRMAARIKGLDGLELCYPSDFENMADLMSLLDQYNFGVSAVNFRSRRTGCWWRGSFSSNIAHERTEVVDDLKRAVDAAADLGCRRITTCPLNEGSDYLFEMDYIKAYDYAAETFAKACAYNPATRICIEYKLSDPRVRCIFGNAGETAAFCQMVGADNLGATFDIGHALYAGERPAQAAALLARAGRLFHVHLNDNEGTWDWDMLPGAYHLWEFVELFHYLKKLGYTEDWYAYDIFPKELDTVETFNVAIDLTRKIEEIAERIDPAKIEDLFSQRNPNKVIPYLYSLI